MINLIVFSRNRAMQLHALLDSVELHAKGVFNNVDVLYRADEGFEQGYEILSSSKPYVNMHRETTFKTDLMGLFKMDYTLFAADDDIVFGDFNKGLLQAFTPETACFSLRLGLNIDYCYPVQAQIALNGWEQDGEFIRWKWRGQPYDFGYPLSVVSHVFRTADIKGLSELEDFTSPNTYEAFLQKHLNKVRPEIAAYKKSRVFGVPANRVQTDYANINALKYSYQPEGLELRYCNGERIDVAKMKYKIHQAQQEIEYIFK